MDVATLLHFTSTLMGTVGGMYLGFRDLKKDVQNLANVVKYHEDRLHNVELQQSFIKGQING